MQPTDISQPEYFHKVVDCQWACPAHTPVPEYIRFIAAGRYDGYWELGLKPWDMAAGMLIVREAGGFVTDPGGGDPYAEGNVVAGNQGLHGKLREVVQEGIAAAQAARGRATEAPPAAG